MNTKQPCKSAKRLKSFKPVRTAYAMRTELGRARCEVMGVTPWQEYREVKRPPSDFDVALSRFIALDFSKETVYGITYKGRDYDCGSMPSCIGRVLRGMAIALDLIQP